LQNDFVITRLKKVENGTSNQKSSSQKEEKGKKGEKGGEFCGLGKEEKGFVEIGTKGGGNGMGRTPRGGRA